MRIKRVNEMDDFETKGLSLLSDETKSKLPAIYKWYDDNNMCYDNIGTDKPTNFPKDGLSPAMKREFGVTYDEAGIIGLLLDIRDKNKPVDKKPVDKTKGKGWKIRGKGWRS